MTTYVVDMSKSPDELVVELFNHDNQTSYTKETLVLGDKPIVLSEDPYGDTKLSVKTLVDIVDIPELFIRYNRIKLDHLFSVVDINLREVDIIDLNRTMVDQLILDEVARKYGVSMSLDDFDVIHGESEIRVAAKDTNVAYSGSAEVFVEASLFTRIANKQLNGFNAKADLETEVVFKVIEPFEAPDDYVESQESFTRLTWWSGFTHLKELMALNADGTFVHLSELNAKLLEMNLPEIPEGTTAVMRQTDESLGDNMKYDNVVVTDVITYNGSTGRLYLHFYNEEA